MKVPILLIICAMLALGLWPLAIILVAAWAIIVTIYPEDL